MTSAQLVYVTSAARLYHPYGYCILQDLQSGCRVALKSIIHT